MTYIEFFDKNASENIGVCLSYLPKRVILLGDDEELMLRHIANYKKVLGKRDPKIEILYRLVAKDSLENGIAVLTDLVETYDDCVFDINGGDELLNLALGIVYGRHSDRKIQIQKIDLRNNKVFDCDKDGITVFDKPPRLTVDENICIYGGAILYGNIHEEDKTYRWNMNADFLRDIDLIWGVCKGNVRYWNYQSGIMEAIEEVGTRSADQLQTVASRAAVEHYLAKKRSKYKISKGIFSYLRRNRLLLHFQDDGATITVRYKNAQVKKCLTKAGTILELKVFALANGLKNAAGLPIYHDALTGVLIDWDGKFHNEKKDGIYDTENEIDVLLMHGIVPVFISCKNGEVKSEELYKLNTVAERFGGKYAKKVLIATALEEKSEADAYLRQRAEDMQIKLIEGLQEMTDEEIGDLLRDLWSQEGGN